MTRSRHLFVTGKLAEPALRRVLASVAAQVEFDWEIAVLPISVAALATTQWIANHLEVPETVDKIILPGLCSGDLAALARWPAIEVTRGPDDLRDLPAFLGSKPWQRDSYGAFDIEILAEINHAPRQELRQILLEAARLRRDGADVIDLGCDPGSSWSGAGEAVRLLKAEGIRVSIDSFNAFEVEQAVRAGAELVLSVNSSNRERAADWGCHVVAIPDAPEDLASLDRTVEWLDGKGVRFRIDPIVTPIGFGFAASLGRYMEVRRRYPNAELMMGVGNLTELTDVDSAGVNVTLLGFCQELGIRSVLTTEVINWCRSCVRELDLARRLVHYAVTEKSLPKHIQPDLVLLRDPSPQPAEESFLRELQSQLKDRNFRLFAGADRLFALNGDAFHSSADPFALFQLMQERGGIDPDHAFYLGYELAKAVVAMQLGKRYVQDQALRWGFLTVPEISHGVRMKGANEAEKHT